MRCAATNASVRFASANSFLASLRKPAKRMSSWPSRAASASARNAAASAISARASVNSRRWTARMAVAQARIARRDALSVISRASCLPSSASRASWPASAISCDRSGAIPDPMLRGGGPPEGELAVRDMASLAGTLDRDRRWQRAANGNRAAALLHLHQQEHVRDQEDVDEDVRDQHRHHSGEQTERERQAGRAEEENENVAPSLLRRRHLPRRATRCPACATDLARRVRRGAERATR